MIDYTYLNLQNPWWDNPSAIHNDQKLAEFDGLKWKYIPREILTLKLHAQDVHIITGPRQTGKSTTVKLYIRNLLEQKFPPRSILFFNCDALSRQQEIISLVVDFIKENGNDKKAFFLDEITSVENWPQAIKWLADAGQLANATVFLTGSSSINLKKSGEFLPGRRGKGKDMTLLPVRFRDYLTLKKMTIENPKRKSLESINACFEAFLLSGGYLRNINYGAAENTELYLATLRSELFKAGRKEDFLREVVKKLLASLSSQTSYTNIAEEAELGSKNTAIEYLGFLINSFFLCEVKAYDPHQKRTILKKNKKFYASDPYLIWLFHCFVWGNENPTDFVTSYQGATDKGKLVENFIATELYKSGVEFYYSQNSRELDFFLPKEHIAIEVKYKEKITTEDIRPLSLAPLHATKILVSKNTLQDLEGVSIIPASLVTLSPLWPKK